MNRIEGAIPKHTKGIKKNFDAARKFISVEDAKLCYDQAIRRLVSINQWHKISPAKEGGFQLMSKNLKPQKRKAKLQDYVRIGIPGPGNADGAGFDWVIIDTLTFSSGRRKEQCLMILKPTPMPGSNHTNHFFDAASSSSFLLTRNGRLVTAEYFGHNEVPNTDASGIIQKARNIFVATGAVLGVSETLWAPLIEGLLVDGTVIRERQGAQRVAE